MYKARRRWVPVSLAVAVALSTGACGESANRPSDVSLIEWSSSFGFCPPTAYCTTRLRITGTQAVLTRESRQSPPLSETTQLSASEADALARAAAQVRFEGLGPVIGCPDCADGGAETVSVTAAGQQRTVTFEFNADVDALEPLLGQLRSLVARLRPTLQ
jgi:hypothetical protein